MNENRNSGIKVLLIILIILVLSLIVLLVYKMLKKEDNKIVETENREFKSSYRMSGNSLEDFDLYFLKLENNSKNMIYSPLSIKYTLSMLKEGTDKDSYSQIDSVVGDYVSKKYNNSNNMSLANALFVRDSFKDAIKSNYIEALKSKYNAEVIYDSFKDANNINKWVSNKTFDLIPNLLDDVSGLEIVLTNALAIDMEWVRTIQAKSYFDRYGVSFAHEDYNFGIASLDSMGYDSMKFEGTTKNIKSVQIGAVANKYDIVKTLGEENIRKTVGNELEKWLDEKCNGDDYDVMQCDGFKEDYPTNDKYLDEYIKSINSNYKNISGSTDFYFYVDDDVKMFAKDLKEYDGTTLQYVGIMPIKEELSKFIENIDSKKINSYISNLKGIELDSFEEGYVTELKGSIPLFNFEYEVNLMKDLKNIGITDVFDSNKANLSKITDNKLYISTAKHKANIEFSNEGIKASAAVSLGGAGATGGGFDYFYEVPLKEIDLTFDKPYIFIIRDKDTGEVWFTGSVYEPTENSDYKCDDYGNCLAN